MTGVAEALANCAQSERDASRPWLLAPCDLQAIKAAGVTFADSLVERVIEERARGDAGAAVRAAIDAARRLAGSLRPARRRRSRRKKA